MIKAALRLLLISIGTLILAFFAVLLLRQTGLRQSFAAPPHPWFEMAEWRVYKAPLEELCGQAEYPSDWIVFFEPVFQENRWVMPCPGSVLIADFLRSSKHRKWMIEVNTQNNQILSEFAASLKDLKPEIQLSVNSRSQRALRQLRKEAPQWLFASDASTLTRLHLFSAFGLETAFDFWPDFVIVKADTSSPFHLSKREATELERRKKRILWNQIESAEQAPQHAVHGVMTDRRKLP